MSWFDAVVLCRYLDTIYADGDGTTTTISHITSDIHMHPFQSQIICFYNIQSQAALPPIEDKTRTCTALKPCWPHITCAEITHVFRALHFCRPHAHVFSLHAFQISNIPSPALQSLLTPIGSLVQVTRHPAYLERAGTVAASVTQRWATQQCKRVSLRAHAVLFNAASFAHERSNHLHAIPNI